MKWNEPRLCKNCETEFTPPNQHYGKMLFCTYGCRERYYHRQANEKRARQREARALIEHLTPQ